MIDPTLPMELDDGTPVRFVSANRRCVRVWIPKNFMRDGSGPHKAREWAYRIEDGVWDGRDAKSCFTLRNVIDTTPEEYEGWFV